MFTEENLVRLRDILAELGRKNVPALRELCARNLPVAHRRRGGAVDILVVVHLLKPLTRVMEGLGLAEHLRLDFSIVNDMSYYNGLIFRGYLPGLASGVLAGGRVSRW